MERRIVMTANVQADSYEDLRAYLRSFLFDLDRMKEEREYKVVSGGYSSGATITIGINKDMTGDKYRKWLEEEVMQTDKTANIR